MGVFYINMVQFKLVLISLDNFAISSYNTTLTKKKNPESEDSGG